MSQEQAFVLVIGYPKSGNTYLSRLLGEALNSPVSGLYAARAIATEGQGREGRYRIIQLPLRPSMEDLGEMLPDSHILSVPRYDGTPLIHIVRDPRDVVVSAYHFWQLASIDHALTAVGEATTPLRKWGTWSEFVENWLECPLLVHMVHYEDLVKAPEEVLESIFERWELEPATRLDTAIARQSIETKRKQIAGEVRHRPFGKEVQLRNLRKGIAGDWRNHFSTRHEDRAREYFGRVAKMVGYDL